MEPVKEICVIIVSYNGMRWIERCLQTLMNSSVVPSVLVVDNGSVDGTPELISSQFTNVHLIRNKRNLGFGKANNIGIATALQKEYSFFFLLNQDVYVEEYTLQRLSEAMKENPLYGIISPLHLSGQKEQLDGNFLRYLMASAIETYVECCVLGQPPAKSIIDSGFINAAAWMLSRKCIESTGGFAEIFYHYGEDRDYCQRVLFHKLRIGVLMTAKIVHDRKRSGWTGKPATEFDLQRETIHFLNQACDLNNSSYSLMVFRRSFRYMLEFLFYGVTFRFKKSKSSLLMLKMIFSFLPRIIASRRISFNKTLPYLS